jgi:hypothetical protein
MKMSGRLQGGFNGGWKRQGGWIGAAIGLAGSLFGASQARKQAKADAKLAQKGIEAADPYGPYRKQAAEELNKLSAASVVDTPEWKVRQEAASRQMAAQGYTGSGNAIVAAADAGNVAYQQAFDNLARKAGIDVQPGGGYAAALESRKSGNDNVLGGIAGIVNNAANFGMSVFNRPYLGNQRGPG